MLEPIVIKANQDGTYETGHVVNLYIHLLPAHHRRVVLARKQQDKGETDVSTDGPSIKKSRPAYDTPRNQDRAYVDNRPYADRRQPYDNTKQLMSRVEQMVDQKLTTATLATAFPPLPATKAPSWNTDDTEDLPENWTLLRVRVTCDYLLLLVAF